MPLLWKHKSPRDHLKVQRRHGWRLRGWPEVGPSTCDKVEIGCEVQGVAMSLAGLCEKELAVRHAAAALVNAKRIGVDVQVRFWDALLERYIGGAKTIHES